MGSTERRAREKVALRQQILDAARDLFVSEGYDAVSMRKIADRIEYSPTAIYLHFADKQALFTALCDETFEKLAARLEALVRRQPDPLDPTARRPAALRRLRARAPASLHGDLPASRHAARRRRSSSPPGPGLRRASTPPWRRRWPPTASAPATSTTMSQALWAACHGVVALLITLPEGRLPVRAGQAPRHPDSGHAAWPGSSPAVTTTAPRTAPAERRPAGRGRPRPRAPRVYSAMTSQT